MFDLFNNKVEYPINHLLGFDVNDPLLQSFYQLGDKNELTLISQLAVEGASRLALLANHGSLPQAVLQQKASDLEQSLAAYHVSKRINSGWIYNIDDTLKAHLDEKKLKALNNGLLFLDSHDVQLSSDDINELIFEFQLQELSPVLVFPEKNKLFIKNPKLLSRLHHRGVYFLVDWLSLNGSLGYLSQKIAMHLLGDKSVKCIGFGNKDLSKIVQNKGLKIDKQVARQLDAQLFT